MSILCFRPLTLGSSRLGSFGGVLLVYAIVAVVLGIGAVAAWVWTSAAGRSPATAGATGHAASHGNRQAEPPRFAGSGPGGPATRQPRGPASGRGGDDVQRGGRHRGDGSTGQSLVPVMIYITDDAGKGAAFPVPAGR